MSDAAMTMMAKRVGRVAGLAAFFLLVFLGTTVACAFAAAQITGFAVFGAASLVCGTICGLIVWLFLLAFHVKKEVVTLPVGDDQSVMNKMETAMAGLGYEVHQASTQRLVGDPSFASFLLGGSVQAEQNGENIRLTGPKMSVEKIRRQFRVNNHLTGYWTTEPTPEVNEPDAQLRGVHLSFELRDEHDPELFAQVVRSLKQKGATVSCELNLWAQCDAGVSEADVEHIIHEQLASHGVAVASHKKPATMHELEIPALV